MADFRKVPVLNGTTIRLGGSTRSDNVIGEPRSVPKGDYPALVQCAGQDVTDEQNHRNFWWVLVETPQGTGWVSAVRVDEGGDDQPIDRVTRAATVFDAQVPAGPHRKVPIVPGGGRLRRGGSTKGDRDNVLGRIDGGISVPALVQCPGEAVDIGPKNFWWVLVDAPGGPGWISAVLVDEGRDNEAIKDVPVVRTVFSRPPDLLP